MMKPLSHRTIGLIVMMTFAIQSIASAHAFLDHAEPRVGSTTGKAPSEVRIWFTQRLEPAFSKIQVFDAQGKEIDKRDTHVDPKEKNLLRVSLPELPAGTYKVSWRVVSVDTHRTQGDFKFTVEPKS
jgi:methionine-rich copper-binding protein CopC